MRKSLITLTAVAMMLGFLLTGCKKQEYVAPEPPPYVPTTHADTFYMNNWDGRIVVTDWKTDSHDSTIATAPFPEQDQMMKAKANNWGTQLLVDIVDDAGNRVSLPRTVGYLRYTVAPDPEGNGFVITAKDAPGYKATPGKQVFYVAIIVYSDY
jgi:hypothetical protein